MLLRCEGLRLGYRGRVVLDDVSFTLAAGQSLAVIGHNGSGKSTLLKTLLGVQPQLGGTLSWPSGRPHPIAYLGQRNEFDQRFPIRVADLVAMGAWQGLGFKRGIGAAEKARIHQALEQTGCNDFARAPLHELSAGQLQRALFARAIVQDARLILLDEPFTAIDQRTEESLLALLADWRAEGRALILVLHDLTAALATCDLALLLGKGKAVFGKPAAVLDTPELVAAGYISQSRVDWMQRPLGRSVPHG